MKSANLAAVSESRYQHHVTFFRQSGWMMLATVLGGVLMYALLGEESSHEHEKPDGESTAQHTPKYRC